MKHSILRNKEVYISRWLKLHSKDINAKDVDTNGFQENKVKDQEFVQNAKALIGINHGRNNCLN